MFTFLSACPKWRLPARVALFVVVIGALASEPRTSRAGPFLWDGGSTTSNDLANSQNYSPDGAPPNDGTAALEFPDSPRPFPTAFSNWNVEGILFTGSSTSYDLIGGTLFTGIGGIVNLSGRTQIIDNDVIPMTPQFWSAQSGQLILNGDVGGGTGALHLGGDDDYRFNGNVNGGLTMEGVGRVTLRGNNGLGFLQMNNGMLEIDTDQPVAPTAIIFMEDGTTFRSTGFHDCNANLSIEGTVTYDGSGILTVRQVTGEFDDLLDVRTSGELKITTGGYDGNLQVSEGTLFADTAGPTFSRSVTVGDAVGPEGSALLRTLSPGQFDPFAGALVREDGLLDLQGGEESVGALQMQGGRVTGGALSTLFGIQSFPSAETARIEVDWLPADPAELTVEDGAAIVDLDLAGSLTYPFGTPLTKEGAGTLRFSGESLGDLWLEIGAGEVVLETVSSPSQLVLVDVGSGAKLTMGVADQLGTGCQLSLSGGATADLQADQQILDLFCDGGTVEGTGTLEVLNEAFFLADAQANAISVPLSFTGESPAITSQTSFTTLSGAVVSANELLLEGSGQITALGIAAPVTTLDETATLELRVASLLGDLNQASGTLSPDRSLSTVLSDSQGELLIQGDWQFAGGNLLVEIDGSPASLGFDRIRVEGTTTLEGILTVESLSGAEYASGDRFAIVVADSLAGAFVEEVLPPIGAELSLEVEYDDANATVYLNVVGTPSSAPEGPEQIPLHQGPIALHAFPNPIHHAHQSVTIAYSVESPGRVRAELFDVSGRRAAVLLDQRQPVGMHQLHWSDRARELPSGGYVLLLRSPGKVERTPVTIIR